MIFALPECPGPAGAGHRFATPVKWVSAAAIIAALLVIARALPVDRGVAVLEGWVDDLGVWGPVPLGLSTRWGLCCSFQACP